MGAQARLDVAQALAKGELRKCHRQELIEMRERQCRVAARITGDTAPQRVQRQVPHQLSKHQLAAVHVPTSRLNRRKACAARAASSSRVHPVEAGFA